VFYQSGCTFSITPGKGQCAAARSRIREGSGGILLVADSRLMRNSQKETPSLRQVFLRLAKVSRQRRPRSLRVPPLTFRVFGNRCGMPQYIVVIESQNHPKEPPVTIPIEHLLNIPGIRVLSVKYDEHKATCQVESTQGYSICHTCGRKATEFHEHGPELELRHRPLWGRGVLLRLRPKRYRCRYCADAVTPTDGVVRCQSRL